MRRIVRIVISIVGYSLIGLILLYLVACAIYAFLSGYNPLYLYVLYGFGAWLCIIIYVFTSLLRGVLGGHRKT